MRVLTGMLIQESNTFSPVPSGLDDFEAGCLRYDQDSIDGLADTRTEIGGFIQSSRRHGVELVPTLTAWASSGGPISARDFNRLTAEFLARVRAAGHVDGVLLALHGAWVSEQERDADGWLLTELRRLVGRDVPIVATLDLHANVTEAMVKAADALVGFRSYPHTDMYETGERAAELLFHCLKARSRPAMAIRKLPMVVPPENAQTTEGPAADVMREVIGLESLPGVRSASLFVVQPWLDVAEMGCTVVVVTDGGAQSVQQQADRVAELLWSRRHEFHVPLLSPHEAVRQGLQVKEGPVLLVDSADGVSSGAPGDSTALLRELVDAPLRGKALLTLVDPYAARAAAPADGKEITLAIGGRLDPARHQPVPVTGVVRRLTGGRLTFTAGVGDGLTSDMGTAVVLESGMLQVLLTERPVPCYDPGIYCAAGLDPSSAQLVVVKSPNNFRWTYRDIAKQWIYVDAPGASTPRLQSLSYHKVQRPLFPLDDWNWRPNG